MVSQQDIDRQKLLDYKEEVKKQYDVAYKTNDPNEVNKANKMYGVLMYYGNQYMQRYQEPIDIFLK